MKTGWFEDFFVGQQIRSPAKTFTESEIIDYAFTYDPQPFHIDRQAAADSIYGGIIASGWQVMAVAFRLFIQTDPFGDASLGSPGVDELRWLRPVKPGDSIRTIVTCTETRPSRSNPDRGIALFDYNVVNQREESVMTLKAVQLLRRRPD